MDQPSVAPSPRSVVGEQLRALRRHWRLIALVTVLAVAASVAYSATQLPQYRSTAEVLLSPTSYDVQRGGSELTAEEMATQVRIVTSRPVAGLVQDDLRLEATPALDDLVTVEALGSSRVLRITARSSHPVEAAEVARSVATSYLAFRQDNTQRTLTEVTAALTQRQDRVEDALNRLDETLANGSDPGGKLATKRRNLEVQLGQITTQVANLDIAVTGGAGGELLNQPEDTTAKVAPRPVLNGMLMMLIGLLCGIALALTRSRFDDVTHDEADVVPSLDGAPILARVPRWKVSGPDDRLVTVTHPRSRSSQSFQELAARVRFAVSALPDAAGRGAVLMCTSAEADEGKTDVAANLAVAAAKVGMRVVLVDADLRRPPGDRLPGVPEPAAGLSDVLGGGRRVEPLLIEGPVANLSLLPAGSSHVDPAGLVTSTRLRPVLAALAEEADLVVVDTAPNARYSDSLEVASVADATVLVARLGRSHRSTLRAAAERLHDLGAENLGAVVIVGPAKGERSHRTARSAPQPAPERETFRAEPSPDDRTDPPGRSVRDPQDTWVRQSPRG